MGLVTADVCVVGAGPAGLTASIEAAKYGLDVLVVDSNLKPGGQLIKQIHKFFGSREHKAGTRGIDIAQMLYKEALDLGVRVWLDSTVYGVFGGNTVEVARGVREAQALGTTPVREVVKTKKIVLAVGAAENPLRFEGWTLPGVMGAGAAQTMINVERVLPGRKILMVGSGNVGLIVSYQLTQAGAEVVCLVEAAPKIGGYGVHAAKIRRAGISILTSHTVLRAFGKEGVSGAEIVAVDSSWQPIPGTEEKLDVDTICVATGLRPFTKLAAQAGCKLTYSASLGGWLPIHNSDMMTTVSDIYIAGDLAGVEEASTAMEEGRLAGISIAKALERIDPKKASQEAEEARRRLDMLRMGPFGQMRHDAKAQVTKAGDELCQRI
ncbi:MAG TPA: FAD-dependent oxidoreductase [Firmicutes bacterium]|nr:FAD-dependent oxidoreductase [Candidatus Fermentithermobacillaceae bacterium]